MARHVTFITNVTDCLASETIIALAPQNEVDRYQQAVSGTDVAVFSTPSTAGEIAELAVLARV